MVGGEWNGGVTRRSFAAWLYSWFGALPVWGADDVFPACDVLGDLQRYRGKVIKVRGILAGMSEGLYLKPGKSEGCTKALIISGYEWHNPMFNLTPPGSPLVEDNILGPHAYDRDDGIPPAAQGEIWVVVTARVEAREKLTMVLAGGGRSVPYGYGHLNACPAQLVYSSIRRIETPSGSAR
jgi:hypothetical protein